MTARHRLPDWLGGHRITALHGFARDDGNVDVELAGRGIFTVPAHWLVIPLPLAWEPPSGGAAASEYTVWLRSFKGWFDGFANDDQREFLSWEELNDRYPEVRELIYDPGRTSPDLPFEAADPHGRTVVISKSDQGVSVKLFAVGDDRALLPRDLARQVAGAIWRAANEPETP